MDIEQLVSDVIDCGYDVHHVQCPGYLESVYKNAMCIELKKRGFNYEVEYPIDVKYNGILVGQFRADIIVEHRLILELKAVENVTKAHEAQLVNYLTATGIEDGLILNFGTEKYHPVRKYLHYKPKRIIP